jgi:YfiH family protein
MKSIESISQPLPSDWLLPQWPVPANVRAVCTTRAGGVSINAYDNMNLGFHVGDDPMKVQHNRTLLESVLGVRPVFLDQIHGTRILELTVQTGDGLQADGVLTHTQGVACTVMVADCLPILLCAVKGGQAVAVSALHAGWRSLLGFEGRGVVEAVYERFMPLGLTGKAQQAIELIAWLGPCIGPQAFEVGDEVRSAFVANAPQAAARFAPLASGKWHADLPGLARQRLAKHGITSVYGNDGTAPWCTVTNRLRFFSHRRDRVSGRQAACIWLT